jgi:hypothetical protein
LGAAGFTSAYVRRYPCDVLRTPAIAIDQLAALDSLVAAAGNTHAKRGPIEPCAIVSSVLEELTSGTSRHVPAELAMRCLKSVRVDTKDNIRLIGDLKLYAAWKSNLAYLKKPPSGYTEAAVDIMGEMDSMLKQLELGNYNNEYDFQFDLSTLFGSAYENHFTWVPDVLPVVFQFEKPDVMELVSASPNGLHYQRSIHTGISF